MSNSDISSRESISRLNISLIDEDLAFEIDDFEAVEEQTSRTHEDIPRKNPGKIGNMTNVKLVTKLMKIVGMSIKVFTH